MPYSPSLAPQPRPHALADLEVLIAKAEANRDRHRHIVERGVGADRIRAEAYLQIAENRLAQLYRSREVLLSGEERDGAEAEAS